MNILISGASIAGPALAIALARRGFRPVVVERAPALRAGGYKIDVRGVAVDVLRRLGVHAAVQRASTDVQGGTFVDGAGRPLVTLDGATIGFRCGEDLEVLRGDLARILYEQGRDAAEYRFGDSIASLHDDGDGVAVTFERGAPQRFDLVIGTDGLRSQVRRLAFAEADAGCERPLGNYIAIFSVPNDLCLDRWEMIQRAPNRIVQLYSTRGDATAKACFIFAAPGLSLDRHDVAAQKRCLAGLYAGMGWQVPRLLAAMDTADDFYCDAMTQIELPRWSAGRVALVGDAAYCPSPASGQGTSLALVGAEVLAAELGAAGGDHGRAFAAWEARMRPFVTRNQELGRDVARTQVHSGRAQIWLETQLMRVLAYLPWKARVMAGFLEKVSAAANAIALSPP
jgi:2-polyprenyl-6-methoxyphenol hydroxylase-like FAD-dependent oxidoreductase